MWRFQAELARRVFPGAAPRSQPALEIVHSAHTGQGIARFHKLQHFRAPEQTLLSFVHILRNFRAQPIARNQRLRKGALGFFFGKATQAFHDCVIALGIKLALQSVILGNSRDGFIDDLAQASPVGQGQLQKFHQPLQLGRNLNFR